MKGPWNPGNLLFDRAKMEHHLRESDWASKLENALLMRFLLQAAIEVGCAGVQKLEILGDAAMITLLRERWDSNLDFAL